MICAPFTSDPMSGSPMTQLPGSYDITSENAYCAATPYSSKKNKAGSKSDSPWKLKGICSRLLNESTWYISTLLTRNLAQKLRDKDKERVAEKRYSNPIHHKISQKIPLQPTPTKQTRKALYILARLHFSAEELLLYPRRRRPRLHVKC